MKAPTMEQGDAENMDDKKLDWMYKSPHETVNREDYLLGRAIDKQFEQMVQAEKDADQNKPIKNHVEHECIPPSLRFFSGNEQVDLARKLQEDPLYAIKKKEMETRSQLLKNPVKLKHLQQLVAQQKRKSKDDKKKKKKKKKSDTDESDIDKKLDDLLAAKYRKLKDKINEEDLLKSIKKHKKNKKDKKNKRKAKSSSSEDSEDSESDSSSSDESVKKKSKKNKRKIEELEKYDQRNYHKRKDIDGYDKYSINSKEKKEKSYNKSSKHGLYSTVEEYKNLKQQTKNYGLMKADGTKLSPSKNHEPSTKEIKHEVKPIKKWVPPKKQKLSEHEKERRRQEMMSNASWRDKQREQNVKKYEEQERKELTKEKSFDKSFVQKHLALAADKETVASRIKSNINNIQRYKHSMDKNFARR